MPKQFKSKEEQSEYFRMIAKKKRPNSKGGYFRQLIETGQKDKLKEISKKGGKSVNK